MDMISFFNTLKKEIIEFSHETDKDITIYNCGPTTCRKHTSIGNLRSYLFSDALKRFFAYLGMSTKHAIKITDVDDRIIKEIGGNKAILDEYNEKHIKDFQRMLHEVNALPVDYLPRVTENMKEIIDDIAVLERKGYTYTSSGSLYFDVTKSKDYGLLMGGLNKNGLINAQKRLGDAENDNKKNPNDFCLWKAHLQEEGEIYRESPRGIGRPGRHSQCSTITRKYLGDTVDIHGGGMSHIFPHHENERVQSEIITGKEFVRYRLHHEYVIFEDGCYISLDDVKEKGYDPLVVRLFLIKKHYRSKLNFTYDSLNAIRQDIKKIIRFLLVLDSVIKNEPMGGVDDAIRSCEKEILKDLCEDMNVSNAITALFEFINKMNALMMNISMSEAKAIKEFMFKIDGIFGFIESAYKRHNDGFKTIMKEAGLDGEEEIRLALRDAGELEKADAIRDNFKKHGIDMEIRRGFGPLLYMDNVI